MYGKHLSKPRFMALMATLFLASCGGSNEPTQTAVDFTDVTLTLFRPFQAGEYVFRTDAELRSALVAAPFQEFPIGIVVEEPAIPNWSFEAKMIIGISQGIGSWCFAPRIKEVRSDGRDLLVLYEIAEFGTLACLRPAPLIGFAQVPRVSGRVEFRRGDA